MNIIVDPSYPTRMQILNAMRRLLQDESLDNISVKSICEEAGVSRSTFYRHFEDKYNIVNWHFSFFANYYLYETGRTLTWYEANYLNSVELELMRDIYIPAFHTEGFHSFLAYAERKRRDTLIETITQFHHVKMDDELMVQVCAIARSEPQAVKDWALAGMPYGPEKLAEYLDNIVPRRLYNLLNEPVSPVRGDIYTALR